MRGRTISMALTAILVAATFSALGRAQESALPAKASPAVVPTGTRFLVGLDDNLSTKSDQPGQSFRAKTLEPLETSDGTVLPPGAEVRGHISRVDPAGTAGRARLWLTFDDIRTPAGKAPLVAQVVSVPGEMAVKPGESREGEIEARMSYGKREMEAAGAGAAAGAAAGAKNGKRDAAIGAAIGGATAFLAASGFGRELELPKDTKLELELIRPLHLGRR
jgi:hypothetical protein